MTAHRHDRVAAKAFELWEASGRPDGQDAAFWQAAETSMEEHDMSVQVRRRRESAAFLQSFVGAQGELLVDTTNNRVQVHDGTTPGGWPAAAVGDLSGRNAIVNGTFVVNQRGYASGTALAAGAYAHDRWKAGAGGCTYGFTQAVPDTKVTVGAGTLIQAVDAPNVTAAAMWLTWTGTAQARVWQGASPPTGSSGPFSAGTAASVGGVAVNALLVTGLGIGAVTNVEFQAGPNGGTLGLVQLEAALPNAGPTRFERRHLGQEIALCQRYYYGYTSPGGADYFLAVVTNSTVCVITSVFPVTMRAAPTCTVTGGTTGTFSANQPSVTAATTTRAFLRGDTTTPGNVVWLTSFTASAEL